MLPLVSTANLEGYWSFQDDNAGTDLSGKGRHLTTLQNVSRVADPSGAGMALSFPDRSVIRAAYGAAIDGSLWTACSFAFIASMTGLPSGGNTRLVNYGVNVTDGIQITGQDGTGKIVLRFGRAGFQEDVTLTTLWSANPMSYALTFDLPTKAWKLYREGVKLTENVLTNIPVMPNRKIVLGSYDTPGTVYGLIGLIGPVRLYSAVLSPADILSLHMNRWQLPIEAEEEE